MTSSFSSLLVLVWSFIFFFFSAATTAAAFTQSYSLSLPSLSSTLLVFVVLLAVLYFLFFLSLSPCDIYMLRSVSHLIIYSARISIHHHLFSSFPLRRDNYLRSSHCCPLLTFFLSLHSVGSLVLFSFIFFLFELNLLLSNSFLC